MQQDKPQRLRLRYRKDAVLRYISHRDLLRYLLRLLRIAAIPYGVSQGYSPKPKISLCPALPLGVSASGELLDVQLAEGSGWGEAEVSAALAAMREAVLPRRIIAGLDLLEPDAPPVHAQVQQARYTLVHIGDALKLEQSLAADSITIERKDGRMQDVRRALLGRVRHGPVVHITAAATTQNALNILQLAGYLREATGGYFQLIHRLHLLDGDGLAI